MNNSLRDIKFIIAGLFLFFVTLTCHANVRIIIPSDSFDISITPSVSIYEDASRILTPEDIAATSTQLLFTPIHTDYFKAGKSDSIFWFRVRLYNPLHTERDLVITFSNIQIDTIDLYAVEHTENQNPPFNLSAVNRSQFGTYNQAQSFSLSVPPQTMTTYLLRMESDSLINTEIRLKSTDQYLSTERYAFFISSIAIGSALTLMLYFLYSLLANPSLFNASGVISCLTLVLFFASWMGVLRSIIPISHEINGNIETISISIFNITMLLSIYALGWQHRWVRIVVKLLIIPQLLIICAEFLIASGDIELLIMISMLINNIIITGIVFIYKSQHKESQKFFKIFIILFFIFLLLFLFNSYNVLSMNSFSSVSLIASLCLYLFGLAVANEKYSQPAKAIKHENNPVFFPAIMSQISHELRTPINGIIGMYELLNDSPLSANQRDYLNTIELAGKDMLIIANEVSDLGRLQQNQLQLENNTVLIGALLIDTLKHFQQEAARKHIELVLDIADDMPQAVLGDKNRLQILIHNLILRILAYAEYGEFALSASYYQGLETYGVRLHIRISGNVFQQSELRNLFHMLQNSQLILDEYTPRAWNLIIVRALIRAMNGNFEIENLETSGAAITLLLPLKVDHSESKAGLESLRKEENLNGLHVLIVDDNAALRLVLEKQLRRWGVKASSAYSGKEALTMMRAQIAENNPFDIIIIDHDMPIMSGLQLAEKIRTDQLIDPSPASLMLTGFSISTVEKQARAVSIDHIIAKPASGKQLRDAISLLLVKKNIITKGG
ncbi:MAG: 7TM-DISM domain-containing protein [Oleibacter sp.]|nr:7TM-DISM domain-containing protein [Thalassolituus sp.]